MERGQIEARVLKTAEEEISSEANFIFDLGADSLQSLELVAALEEEFAIEMDEAAALEVQTVDGAVGFIQNILTAKGYRLNGNAADLGAECAGYEKKIQDVGGIHSVSRRHRSGWAHRLQRAIFFPFLAHAHQDFDL